MRIPQDMYDVVVRSMPIPCVDVVPLSSDRQVLLVRRAEDPARGEWWFPGGRVHHGEARKAAARRKLHEECGLTADAIDERATFELFFAGEPLVHGITTVHVADVGAAAAPTLDEHSQDACWRPIRRWLDQPLHPFVRARLEELAAEAESGERHDPSAPAPRASA